MIWLILKKAILIGMIVGVLADRRRGKRISAGGFSAWRAKQEERA